ncbi:SDR family NAD(P)-dependent oxidoreductase [Rhodoplanes sp. Z2-YC6860]|uniref:SDR family NAD(P)-dependent oxidoreductase n=1 Tax=Rhodoplanes sp. Z2-YC6860 TaxID=674703 RepID=UPI00078EA58B|nr:SDR family oxidoreductase [Rhodoplanes sp. Z2-YC6860]AMN44681.1 short-chain dehydrogenase/reductase [Rhodoplanes sp. Z2-YC6860]
MSMKLSGKVVLITGGSRGLGAATAAAFADQGADVAISYVASEGKAAAVVTGLEAKGVRAAAIQADQGDLTAAGPLMRRVVETFGKLDILVNNAAVAWQGRTIDDPEIDNAAMDRQWAINAMGVIANIRAASKVLPEGGRIISVGSGLGTRVAFPGTTDYAATKAAVVGYSRGAARDLGRRNITVNVVQAGVMDTDMAASSKDKLPPSLLESLAIRRYAEVNEVAAAIVFLAGPDAAYITGSIIDVSGGFIA